MLKIFITVVAAVVTGGIILKFWRQILYCIIAIITILIAMVVAIPMYIIVLVAKLIQAHMSEESLEETILRTYDEILNVAYTQTEIEKGMRTIKWAENILRQREEKKQDKFVENLLEEYKWVL